MAMGIATACITFSSVWISASQTFFPCFATNGVQTRTGGKVRIDAARYCGRCLRLGNGRRAASEERACPPNAQQEDRNGLPQA